MAMTLRPYQEEARRAVWAEWDKGVQKTLLVLVTGGGKIIIFSKIIEDCVRRGERVLVLAHRGELLDQAADKLAKSTGLQCAVEKAEQSCLGSFLRVVVGSVQTMQRETRLQQFPEDYFDAIIIDEAHHALADGYQRVLEHFPAARVLGVTATPDRGDMKNLGQVFDSLAYEYTLPRAVQEGYLAPIRALTVPLTLDISQVGVQNGDYKAGEVGSALEPYLHQIADVIAKECATRRTVIFLPLVATAQKMRDILRLRGMQADEVNGNSPDRAEILARFDRGETTVLCNAMLLTEGWDCPAVDCIVVLRPTKQRGLYCQMVGRGTRLYPGKDHLLLLDFLWHTERHQLCRPAHLVAKSPEVAEKMVENQEAAAGNPEAVDLLAAEAQAESDVVAQREAALAKQLSEMRRRKRALVDPLQFEMSIASEDLAGYVPSFGWECEPASPKQLETLEHLGICPDGIENAGKASLLLYKLNQRRAMGLTTPKQIRFLEGRGFRHVGQWPFGEAKRLIDRIAANNWRVPAGVMPETYQPETPQEGGGFPW